MSSAIFATGSPISDRLVTRISRSGVADVALAENSCRLVLRGPDAAVSAACAKAGLGISDKINRAARSGDAATLRLGPDEHLVLAPLSRREPLTAALSAPQPTAAHLAMVDVTSRDCGLTLAGPRIETILSVGCPLPLDQRDFPTDRATRTLFGKATIVLWRLGEDRFRIEVGRSFAPYVVGLLAEAINCEQV